LESQLDQLGDGLVLCDTEDFSILHYSPSFLKSFPNTNSQTKFSEIFPEFKQDLAKKRISKNGYYDWESPIITLEGLSCRFYLTLKPFLWKNREVYSVEVRNDNRALEKEILLKKFTQLLEEKNTQLSKLNEEIMIEKKRSDDLLMNILPQKIANELKVSGIVEAVKYELVTVLFSDFIGFTKIASNMEPPSILEELDYYFSKFEEISQKYKLEKIKTIGDAFMAAGGLPEENTSNPVDAILACLEMIDFVNKEKTERIKNKQTYFEMRVGVHSGPVMAGIIGTRKFAYDIWGDSVNTASRMESYGEANYINTSKETMEYSKDFFDFEFRGKFEVKNKGILEMYNVIGIKKSLQSENNPLIPSDQFFLLYLSKFKNNLKINSN
jgi:class 3 adenylate cyclase